MNRMEKIETLFQKIEPQLLTDNFIQTIGDEWMLITAGSIKKYNTMTASWGAVGVLWNKPIAICFIRPTRYTFELASQAEVFTLSFFHEEYRTILNFCGSHSGKKIDKIKETGLIAMITENKGISYKQARMIIECRKVYFDDLKPAHFLNPETDKKHYPKKDYHRMFIGEIVSCYVKK